MSMNLWLGIKGSELLLTPLGRRPLKIDEKEEKRGEEMASGRYVEDIKWRKKEFTIEYSEIKGESLRALMYLYRLKSFLNFKYYDSEGELKEYEVKMSPFDRTRYSLISDEVWTNISFTLRATQPEA